MLIKIGRGMSTVNNTAPFTPPYNPVSAIENLVYEMNPQTATLTSSGADITAVSDALGQTYSSATGRYPHYSGGFLTAPDDTTHLITTSTFSGSATGFGGIVLDIPATISAERSIFAFGSSGVGSQRTNLRIRTNGSIRWAKNDADGFELISANDYRGQRVVLLWNFKGADDVDFYVNSLTPHTFDPRDSMSSQNQILLFVERTTYNTIPDLGIGYFFHKNAAHDAVNDPSISDIANYLATKYGVTLS